MLTRQDNRSYDKPRTAQVGAVLWLAVAVLLFIFLMWLLG